MNIEASIHFLKTIKNMANLKKADATAASKKVAKKPTVKKAVAKRVVARSADLVVNRNRSYKSKLVELKSGLKDCLSLKSSNYISRFGEESLWLELQFTNGHKVVGIPKTRESEKLIGDFLRGKGSFAPKNQLTGISRKRPA
jgi:hypothetical protein